MDRKPSGCHLPEPASTEDSSRALATKSDLNRSFLGVFLFISFARSLWDCDMRRAAQLALSLRVGPDSSRFSASWSEKDARGFIAGAMKNLCSTAQ